MYMRPCSLWWCRAGKEWKTAKPSRRLFLAIASIFTLTESGRQSPSACCLLKDHLNIYKHFFLFSVCAVNCQFMKGWMSTHEMGNQAPLYRANYRLQEAFWAPFCCSSLLAVPACSVSTSVCMPALSVRPGTNQLCFVFSFYLIRFSRFFLKPVPGTGWE